MMKKIACMTVLFLVFNGVFAEYDMGAYRSADTVMTIGGYDVPVDLFDYFYYGNAQQYAYDSGKPDISKSLKEQYNEETMENWSEVLAEQAKDALKLYIGLYLEAMEKNYTLTKTENENLDEVVAYPETEANARGGNVTAQDVLRAYYGPNLTLSRYREISGMMMLVQRFARDTVDGYTFTDEEYETEYAAAPDTYDIAEFRVFSIPGSPTPSGEESEGDLSTEEQEAYYAAQKGKAEKFLSEVADPEDFFALTLAYAEAEKGAEEEDPDTDSDAQEQEQPEDNTLISMPVSQISYSASGDETQYLTDPARKAGDKMMFESNGNFNIFLFISRHRDEQQGVDIRHILCAVDEEDTEVGPAKAKTAAREKAEAILKDWQSDPTEEHFAQLAAEKTDDTSSAPNGGLYQGIKADDNYVKPFLDWSVDEVRKPGDTGIVETDFGFHVMYFVKREQIWKSQVKPALGGKKFEAYSEALKNNIQVDIPEGGMDKAMGDLIPLPTAKPEPTAAAPEVPQG